MTLCYLVAQSCFLKFKSEYRINARFRSVTVVVRPFTISADGRARAVLAPAVKAERGDAR